MLEERDGNDLQFIVNLGRNSRKKKSWAFAFCRVTLKRWKKLESEKLQAVNQKQQETPLNKGAKSLYARIKETLSASLFF